MGHNIDVCIEGLIRLHEGRVGTSMSGTSQRVMGSVWHPNKNCKVMVTKRKRPD